MQQRESRALTVSMWGNLFMGVAGIAAAILSNSQAILVDGLFSMIGFTAAILGKHVTKTATAGPDKHRPFGYAADEAIFVTFRSLSLLGLVLFSLVGAAMRIYAYVQGAEPEPLNFAPLLVYFVGIGLTCALLWFVHHSAWRKTGRKSDVLHLESKAAAFDGFITAAAGIGLVAIELLRDGFLAPIAPIGDSLIVFVLCMTVVTRYYKDFVKGLGELAGVTADPEHIAQARRAVRDTVQNDGGQLHDLSVSKLGRRFWVTVYYDPGRAILAQEVDDLTRQMGKDIGAALSGAEVVLLISQYDRAFVQEAVSDQAPDPTTAN